MFEFFNKAKKKITAIATVCAFSALGAVSAFAEDGTAAAVGAALTTVATDMTGVLTTVAPIALGVVGAILVWKFGLKFFRTITK